MKRRALLIVTGTLGSLGAVLSITPPKFGADSALAKQDAASTNANQSTQTQSNSPSNQQSGSTASSKSGAKSNNSSTNNQQTPAQSQNQNQTQSQSQAQSQSATQEQSQTQAQSSTSQSTSSVSGTFTGNPFEASERGRSWGTVVVKVTFKDGVITSINGNQSPASRGPFAIDQLDPYVAAQKISIDSIKAKSAEALPYVSGVSYTSIAYWNSLKSAIKKAGL